MIQQKLEANIQAINFFHLQNMVVNNILSFKPQSVYSKIMFSNISLYFSEKVNSGIESDEVS